MDQQTIDLVTILNNNREKINKQNESKKFNLSQLSRLNKLVEAEGGYISSCLWDLLLFNVNDLFLNEDEKICYTSLYRPSKKVNKFLLEYNNLIKNNLSYIMIGC